ncbi:MAG: hypothetical protein F6K50_19420 [Moorea sp. SIO3I7]|nr:hypothetical protein [Moorena sp. SIO3I7]
MGVPPISNWRGFHGANSGADAGDPHRPKTTRYWIKTTGKHSNNAELRNADG